MAGNGRVKESVYTQRLKKTFELIETVKNLSVARDRQEHPDVPDEELVRRFWKRCRRQKDSAMLEGRK